MKFIHVQQIHSLSTRSFTFEKFIPIQSGQIAANPKKSTKTKEART